MSPLGLWQPGASGLKGSSTCGLVIPEGPSSPLPALTAARLDASARHILKKKIRERMGSIIRPYRENQSCKRSRMTLLVFDFRSHAGGHCLDDAGSKSRTLGRAIIATSPVILDGKLDLIVCQLTGLVAMVGPPGSFFGTRIVKAVAASMGAEIEYKQRHHLKIAPIDSRGTVK